VQRPARRNGATGGRERSFSPRALFAYVPSVLKIILAILAIVTLFVGYRAAASAALFQARSIDVSGTSRTSAEEIAGLTRQTPGVRRAVVSRVLPDRLRVRVTERVPVAVVRTTAGHFFWVDEEGVALGEMKPADTVPSFFIRGWNEDGTEEARNDNAERVRKYEEVVREWSALGLSDRVSEVNLIDLHDVRAQLAGNDSEIEVRLGGQDLGERLKQALEALDKYRQTPRGSSITYIDLQTGRIVIGTSSGSKVSAAPATDDESKTRDVVSTTTSAPKPANTANANRSALTNNQRQKPAPRNAGGNSANTTRIRLR